MPITNAKMPLKDDLRPVGRNRVIDLVQMAGLDVSGWARFSRGAKYASVNPKYCYEWAFADPTAGIVVLNLWYRNIEERRGVVSARTNMRKFSRDMARRGAKSVWIGRAQRMDDVLRHAAGSKSRVRVIVNDGDMRDTKDPHARASVVHGRLLDPVEWTIRHYDSNTGECLLVRGAHTMRAIDQFDTPFFGTLTPEQVDRHGRVFARDPAVRRAVLSRAGGRCEFCLMPGFLTASGEVFLETHHIVPLFEGGADIVTNVAAICANHHREAHCGAAALAIRQHLLDVASSG